MWEMYVPGLDYRLIDSSNMDMHQKTVHLCAGRPTGAGGQMDT